MTGTTRSPAAKEIRIVSVLTLLAGILRFYRLDHQSLWIDEVLMIQRASIGEPFRWADWLANPQGPFPALLLRISAWAGGPSEWALRLPSAAAGTLTIPLIYQLSKRLGSAPAWPAAFLAAVSPMLVWYSQETRHYAMALFAAAWCAIAFLDLIDEGPSRAVMLSLFGSTLVGMMSHLSMTFVVAAQGLTLVISRRDRLRPWILAVAPAILAMSPWFIVAVRDNLNLKHLAHAGPIPAEEMLRGESTFSWWGVPYTAFVFFAGYSLGPPLNSLHVNPTPAAVLPYLPVILSLALGAALLMIAGLRTLRNRPARLPMLMFWTLVPLIVVVALSLRNARVFNPRYIIVALPLWLCVVGLGLNRLAARSVPAAAVAAMLFLAPGSISLYQYYFDGRYAREDVRSAAALLNEQVEPTDIVLAQGVPQVLSWYYHGAAPVQAVHEFDVRSEERLASHVRGWTRGRRRVWLFIARPWLQDPELRLKNLLNRTAGTGIEHDYNGVSLILYEPASDG